MQAFMLAASYLYSARVSDFRRRGADLQAQTPLSRFLHTRCCSAEACIRGIVCRRRGPNLQAHFSHSRLRCVCLPAHSTLVDVLRTSLLFTSSGFPICHFSLAGSSFGLGRSLLGITPCFLFSLSFVSCGSNLGKTGVVTRSCYGGGYRERCHVTNAECRVVKLIIACYRPRECPCTMNTTQCSLLETSSAWTPS